MCLKRVDAWVFVYPFFDWSEVVKQQKVGPDLNVGEAVEK